MLTETGQRKRALRALLRGARPSGNVAALGARLLSLDLVPGTILAGVSALPGEPELRFVWAEFHERGHPICMPETTAPGAPLRFRAWTTECRMVPGRFGTAHPDGPETVPDVVFVPLLCWDLRLNRLGYGGGYYDRTLAALPKARRIGFGFEAQRVESVPVERFDMPLDALVTETRILFAKERRD
ncbi:5-formyltetrahydrofolate cyclo-ligase [Acetobacteraceae bacterium KSS8]|uniref:5-formyltetrahydrofolate cyclo-ligase n=1 Tax=Endosaccharibacter trunci TaxID=2812733 RepID=A0ABT1W834_9PROT|nr:5-formyltetrahydrofolate cyclo-ligase [Acetobacteraceae bacterium KSS8]